MEKHLQILYCCKSYQTTEKDMTDTLQSINELLGLPELQLHKIVSMDTQEVHLEASPITSKHPCPRAKVVLKSHHRLLNPPADSLPEKSSIQLDQQLAFSPLLREVGEWKEAFSHWYDYSPNFQVAQLGFTRWCQQGEAIKHEAVQSALKTMRNWEEKIMNYHRCHWTDRLLQD